MVLIRQSSVYVSQNSTSFFFFFLQLRITSNNKSIESAGSLDVQPITDQHFIKQVAFLYMAQKQDTVKLYTSDAVRFELQYAEASPGCRRFISECQIYLLQLICIPQSESMYVT